MFPLLLYLTSLAGCRALPPEKDGICRIAVVAVQWPDGRLSPMLLPHPRGPKIKEPGPPENQPGCRCLGSVCWCLNLSLGLPR